MLLIKKEKADNKNNELTRHLSNGTSTLVPNRLNDGSNNGETQAMGNGLSNGESNDRLTNVQMAQNGGDGGKTDETKEDLDEGRLSETPGLHSLCKAKGKWRVKLC